MTTLIAQMFAGSPVNEETVFDIEFTDEHIVDGVYCQVQFSFTPLEGNDAIGVDWGDGIWRDWPKTQTLLAHNWDARGRYRVRFDRRLKWFRFTTAYAIDATTGRVRPAASAPSCARSSIPCSGATSSSPPRERTAAGAASRVR